MNLDLESALSVAGLLPEPVLFVGVTGDMLGLNGAAGTLLGLRPGRVSGCHVSSVLREDPERLTRLLRRWSRVTAPVFSDLSVRAGPGSSKAYRCDGARLAATDAESAVLMLRLRPLPETSGDFVAVSDQLEAMRRRVQYEQGQISALQHIDQRKTYYLGQLGHELKSPLNAVVGFASMLSDRDTLEQSDKATISEYATMIAGAGRHLLAVINNVIDAARLEASSLSLNETEINLARVVADAARLAATGADGRADTRLGLSLPTDQVPVRADERALWQIVINLVGNALKFTPKTGTVTVTLMRRENGDHVLEVADTGPGISADEVERLGRPFTQAALVRGDSRKHGSGLGLAIARELIGLHGGSLTLQSQLDRGTTATVILPADRARPG